MAKAQDFVVNLSLNTTRFHAQMDSLLEPVTWRHRFIEWVAQTLNVKVEVKRRLRGFDRLTSRDTGGFI